MVLLSGRTIGLGFIAAAFLTAVAGGFYLAAQINTDQTVLTSTLAASIPLLILIAFFGGLGIRLYSGSEVGAHVVASTEMLKPRELFDLLKARGQLQLGEIAQSLEMSENEVKATLDQLVTLEVFSGYANWDDDVLGASSPAALRAMQSCVICDTPIKIQSPGQTVCMVCRTAYYLPNQAQDKE